MIRKVLVLHAGSTLLVLSAFLLQGCGGGSTLSTPVPYKETPGSTTAPPPPEAVRNAVATVPPVAPAKTPFPSAPPDPELVKKGKVIYMTNCTACHNRDPSKPGGIGPEIFGSSFELIEARVIHVTYPAGYTPKRKTKAMKAMPHLKDQIPALHAFLNAKT